MNLIGQIKKQVVEFKVDILLMSPRGFPLFKSIYKNVNYTICKIFFLISTCQT